MWVKTMLPFPSAIWGAETAAIFFLGQLGVRRAAALMPPLLLFAINVLPAGYRRHGAVVKKPFH